MSGYPGEGEYSDDDFMNSHYYDHEAHRESLEGESGKTIDQAEKLLDCFN